MLLFVIEAENNEIASTSSAARLQAVRRILLIDIFPIFKNFLDGRTAQIAAMIASGAFADRSCNSC